MLRLVDRFSDASSAGEVFRDLDTLESLVDSMGLPSWTVDVVLVEDAAMATLNQSYRAVADVTDVLSFSYLLPDGEGDPALLSGQGRAHHNLWVDPLEAAGQESAEAAGARLVGELILAPDFVTRRCLEKGWPLEQEIPLLVVHGCLHLLGWRHDEIEDRRAMQNIESELLSAAGLPHPLHSDLAGD